MAKDESPVLEELKPIDFFPYASLVSTRGTFRLFKRHKSLRLARSAVTNGREQRRGGTFVHAIYEWQGDMTNGKWVEIE